MEKLRNFSLDAKIIRGTRARIAASFLVAAGSLIATPQIEGRTPYVYAPIPQEEFHPFVLPKAEAKVRDLTVTIPTRKSLIYENPTPKPTPEPDWKLDPEISFYGPGFYGKRTACGLKLTRELEGVASRTLPCGTPVTFEWKGTQLTVPVVDRGPYVDGRIFDLTGGACVALDHCFTGPINYIIGAEPPKQ